jgi:hypothetical protein
VLLQLDGGLTFTEPTAIIAGQVEGRSDVSGKLPAQLLAVPVLLLCYSPFSVAVFILLTHARFGQEYLIASITPAQQWYQHTVWWPLAASVEGGW